MSINKEDLFWRLLPFVAFGIAHVSVPFAVGIILFSDIYAHSKILDMLEEHKKQGAR